MGQPVIWKGQGQPEKGAEQHIEAVGTDKVGAKVGIPVPEYVTGAYCIVSKHVERDLLHIKISVIDEIAPVINDEGDKNQGSDQKR